MPASNDGFRHLDLRYMQIEISMEAAKNLPGHGLQDFFSLCEFVSHIGWDERSIECYLKVVYDDEKSLEIKHPSVTVIEVITKG